MAGFVSPRLLYTDSRELPAVKEATQHSIRGKVLKSEDMPSPWLFSPVPFNGKPSIVFTQEVCLRGSVAGLSNKNERYMWGLVKASGARTGDVIKVVLRRGTFLLLSFSVPHFFYYFKRFSFIKNIFFLTQYILTVVPSPPTSPIFSPISIHHPSVSH